MCGQRLCIYKAYKRHCSLPLLSNMQPLPHLKQNTYHGSTGVSNRTKHALLMTCQWYQACSLHDLAVGPGMLSSCLGSYDASCSCTVSQVNTFSKDLNSCFFDICGTPSITHGGVGGILGVSSLLLVMNMVRCTQRCNSGT